MKLNKLFVLAALPFIGVAANAQEKGPQRNDFTVAVTAGYNSTVMQEAAAGNLPSYNGFQSQSTNWNDKAMSIGIEGGWFFLDQWKLTLGGGMNITKKPGYAPLPGSAENDESFEWGDIPSYGAVADQSFVQFNVYTGVDRYFKTKVDGLYLYAGARVGYAYGRNTSFLDDENNMGKSIGEAFNIRGALTGGVEYYITDGFFVGAQVDPFAYTYNRSLIKPQEGLSNLDANSHNYAVLAAPTLKVGFKF